MSIVETTTFRLHAGTDQAAFLALDRRVQTELIPNQPGFVRRTTAFRGDDWVVVTLWGSEADAAAFESVAAGDAIQAQFDALVEPGSLQRHRYDTLD
jgi:heme-degrading monooxygenase HmoA